MELEIQLLLLGWIKGEGCGDYYEYWFYKKTVTEYALTYIGKTIATDYFRIWETQQGKVVNESVAVDINNVIEVCAS